MDAKQNILLVGCGNMGSALLRGWLARGIAPERIRVVEAQADALGMARSLGVVATAELDSKLANIDVIVFAVKPQQLESIVPQYRKLAVAGALVLSIAAGKPLRFYEALLDANAGVVRAMPNTPAAIGQGITALVANAPVNPQQRALCEHLMRAGGDVIWLDDEKLMDAVTAVSGSGPAYVFLLVEALAAAGEGVGLDSALALRLAKATVAGAGVYAGKSSYEPKALRQQVTSPGGTTQAALEILLAEDGLTALLAKAVRAAAARSRELA